MIKTLLKSVREYKIYSILCPLVMIVEVLMEVFLVFVNRDMINLMESSNPEISQVLIYGAVLLVMAMISLAAGILGGILGARLLLVLLKISVKIYIIRFKISHSLI